MRVDNGREPYEVVIIGAGLSGLAAARKLLRDASASCRITLLEGSDRVGGRAHTISVPNFGPVEMGATWLHGLEGNPVAELAKGYGLTKGSSGSRRWRGRWWVGMGVA